MTSENVTPEAEVHSDAPKAIQGRTAFMIVMGEDGSTSIFRNDFPTVTVDHLATLEEIERMADHVSKSVGRAIIVSALRPPQEPTTSEKVSKAYASRKKG